MSCDSHKQSDAAVAANISSPEPTRSPPLRTYDRALTEVAPYQLVCLVLALAGSQSGGRPGTREDSKAQTSLRGDMNSGRTLYRQSCTPCHGATGQVTDDGAMGGILSEPDIRDVLGYLRTLSGT